jgi:hypothetical protein
VIFEIRHLHVVDLAQVSRMSRTVMPWAKRPITTLWCRPPTGDDDLDVGRPPDPDTA